MASLLQVSCLIKLTTNLCQAYWKTHRHKQDGYIYNNPSNLIRNNKGKKMTLHPALEIFTELLVPSISGDEKRVASILRKKLNLIGYSTESDPAGNLLVRLPGKDPNAPFVVFAAHMDELGMVVTKTETNGRLRVTRSGGLHPWKLGEGAVDIFGDVHIRQGVLSMGSTHTIGTAEKAITWEDVIILTGLSLQQFKTAGIRPGTPVLPTRERRGPVVFGPPEDPLVGAWTFDDRMGCVTLLRLLQLIKVQGVRPHHPTIISFTTREEIGGHGAKYLARTINPEVFIAVDGSPIPPGSPLVLDGRPGIWVKDRLAQYDQNLVRSFSKAAIEAGTELQPVVFEAAASDASLVSAALGVPRIACIGHVRENSHGYEVARLSVFDHLLNTLFTFIRTFKDNDL